jgi:sporulation protein YlmC with PRC-barrel domain/ElaB/YqjD/DUF883 family membrane-anchored ribosome-binding protein
MEELGRIEVLWMYPPAHRVLGFVSKSGFLGRQKLAFKLSQVEAIGENGILTHSQPDPTDADRVRQLESLIHCELWSETGHKLGRITDCEFNLQTGLITAYLVAIDRLSEVIGSIYRLPPSQITSFGSTRVLVAATSLKDFEPYREGLQEKITKATSSIKEEYTQATQELRSLAQRAQDTTQQTAEQLKTLAEQAKERAQLLAEQAREKAQEFSEQLREGAETLVEQTRETGGTWAERVHDRTETWFENWDDEATPSPRPAATEPVATEDDEDWFADWEKETPPPTTVKPQTSQPGDWFEDWGNTHPTPTTVPTTPEDEDLLHQIQAFGAEEEVDTSEEPWGVARPQSKDHYQNQPWTLDEESFDLDDDPWDITELPEPTEVVLQPLPELQPKKSQQQPDSPEEDSWI